MSQVKKIIALAPSGSDSFAVSNPDVKNWEITALGDGTVTFTPVLLGQTTHEPFILQNDSLLVTKASIEQWDVSNDAAGAAQVLIEAR